MWIWKCVTLRNGVREIPVYHLIDGIECEHFTCNELAFNFLHEMIVPWQICPAADLLLIRRLRCVHIPVPNHQPDDLECICGGRTTHIFFPMTKTVVPTRNMHKASKSADQNPTSRSMYGVAKSERADIDT